MSNKHVKQWDRDVRNKFSRFKKEELCKDFDFKFGINFQFVEEFREVIGEHTILYGKYIKMK